MVHHDRYIRVNEEVLDVDGGNPPGVWAVPNVVIPIAHVFHDVPRVVVWLGICNDIVRKQPVGVFGDGSHARDQRVRIDIRVGIQHDDFDRPNPHLFQRGCIVIPTLISADRLLVIVNGNGQIRRGLEFNVNGLGR